MHIAIASGKGGTGKTTFATSLAYVMSKNGPVAYLDCDVEEPNGHIFLKPNIQQQEEVTLAVPKVNFDKCNYCGDCSNACRFSAIVCVKKSVLTFPKLCHACGACTLACKQDAICEVRRRTGIVEQGNAGKILFACGKLDIGEAMAPPVIRAVLEKSPTNQTAQTTIIDAPPGTSCPVIASLKDADIVLLVTEPTPFGLNDLRLAVDMVRILNKPCAVAINRCDIGTRDVHDFCKEQHLPIVCEIPHSKEIAKAYSKGDLPALVSTDLFATFQQLVEKLVAVAKNKPPPCAGSTKPSPNGFEEPVEQSSLPPSQKIAISLSTPPKELVVLSGKGGTGKTSVVASFFALAQDATVSDCDVDAADLHLVTDPKIQNSWPFTGGFEAKLDDEACINCGLCVEHCRFGAILDASQNAANTTQIDSVLCEGCGVCVDICPLQAVELVPCESGHWYVSSTRHGPMVHATLGVAAENSGKLVSLVRQEASALSQVHHSKLLLIDGSPGIGCPVIASVTGADMVLLVSEPTLSAIHDLKRVVELCRHFQTRTAICINKFDLNPGVANQIEMEAKKLDVPVLGSIRYDPLVTQAQVQRLAVVEMKGQITGPAAQDIRKVWTRVLELL